MKNSLYILGQLTDEDVEWMLSTGSRRQLVPGTILIREGQPADALYIVLDGTLSVTLAALDGREVDQPAVGTIIGEMSFVDAHPPSATVSARVPAVVFAIDHGRLQAKLDQDPAFAARFYRALAILLSDRLRNALAQLNGGQRRGTDGDGLDEDEIDLNVLDNVHLAGARFTRILQRLMTA